MTTHTFSAAPSNATDASFRAWGSAISDALAAVGMVKVATDGQIDWTTALAPTTNGGASGFEIWRFNDPLQAVAPIFFKLEYAGFGPGGSSGNTPGMYLTVGQEVDALGDIGRRMFPRSTVGCIQYGTFASKSQALGYASSCPSGACVIVAPWVESQSAISPMFIIERSRDNTGAPTPDGVMIAVQNPDANFESGAATAKHSKDVRVQAVAFDSRSYNRGTPPVSLPYIVNGSPVAGSSGLAVGVVAPSFPWVLYAPGIAPWQSLAVQTYMQGDAVPGVSSVRVLQQDHTYRTLPVGRGSCGWGVMMNPDAAATALPRAGAMILWED